MLSAGFLSLFPHHDNFTKNYVSIVFILDTFTFARKKKSHFLSPNKKHVSSIYFNLQKELFLFLYLKHKYPERTRRQRSRWTCSTSLTADISEYTFKHKSAFRTPAESGQVYLTSRKEYIDTHKTIDQALSLWSRSTDFKTLDYQRTGVSNSENSHKGNHFNTRPGITQLSVSLCAGHLI